MGFLSLIGFFIFLALAYNYPRKMGWAVIILAPILGAGQFTFVPSTAFPLTTYRAAFAVSLGILMAARDIRPTLKRIWSSKAIKALLLFIVLYGLSALRDRPVNTIVTFVPTWIFPLLIAGFMVRRTEDLKLMTKIFAFQAVIIGLFIIIEYYSGFNISVLLKQTNPNLGERSLWIGSVAEGYQRSGYYRASGIDGHPVFTGYRLAFLFPLVLWYAKDHRSAGVVYSGLIFLSLLLLQTRTAIIVTAIAILMVSILGKKKNMVISFGILIGLVLVGIQIPFIRQFIIDFWYASFEQVTLGIENRAMAERFYRIPFALEALRDHLFIGFGSRNYVLYQVMPAHSNDLPAPILYLVSGGIFTGLAWISAFVGMIIGTWDMGRKTNEHTTFYVFLGVALFAGTSVMFVNMAENHIIPMIMLYTGVYNVYSIKRREQGSNI